MVLSGNPAALCRLLGNLEESVFPWTPAADLFVFSHNNSAAEMPGCQHQLKTCDLAAAPEPGSNCSSPDNNVFFLPLREEWRTPAEAGEFTKWQTPFPEGYRRMVCGTLRDSLDSCPRPRRRPLCVRVL